MRSRGLHTKTSHVIVFAQFLDLYVAYHHIQHAATDFSFERHSVLLLLPPGSSAQTRY
jgi:hypothetical protein